MNLQSSMQKRIFKSLSILFLIIIISLIYYFLSINFHFYIPCIFHKITGLYCPGCGITRCLFSLLCGNIKQAFFYNMLVCLFFPVFLFYAGYKLYIYIMGRKDNLFIHIPKWVLYFSLLITILFGILRNIPYFSILAPTQI